MKISIIGFGKLGRALADILSVKKGEVSVVAWDIIKSGDHRQVEDITEAVKGSGILIFAVPSANFYKSAVSIGLISSKIILVSCTKGFDGKTGKFPFEILQQLFPANPVAVISGPMLSEELSQKLPTVATLATSADNVFEAISDLFQSTSLHLVKSADLIGVSLWGILKNIYALALGAADGLEMGSNFKACLTLTAITETQRILQQFGGNKETLLSPAGLADFLTTGYSERSRNYSYGFRKSRGENLDDLMAEGVVNIKRVIEGVGDVDDYSVLKSIKHVFLEGADPKKTILGWFGS